jgi:hypothetical protein
MAMKKQHERALADLDKEEPRTIAGGVAACRQWLNCLVSKGGANRWGDDRRQPKPGARHEEAPTLDLVSCCHATCQLSPHEMMNAATETLTTAGVPWKLVFVQFSKWRARNDSNVRPSDS